VNNPPIFCLGSKETEGRGFKRVRETR